MKNRYRFLSLTLLLLAGLSARAETTNCTAITQLPKVITSQGVYCLTGNLSTSMTTGNAIEIQANNVTIDLNGYKLGGLGAGAGTNATGIFADQRKNITIKNGITRGFLFGILLRDFSLTTSSGHVVKNILADQNTLTGIGVMGLGHTVSHNTVVDTGGSTIFNAPVGIVVVGSGAKVTGNAVSTTTATGTGRAVGIFLESADYSLAQNNTVTDTLTTGTGGRFAIEIQSSAGVFLSSNNLANAGVGLNFVSSSGKYFNTLTFDIPTVDRFIGGTAVGNNNN